MAKEVHNLKKAHQQSEMSEYGVNVHLDQAKEEHNIAREAEAEREQRWRESEERADEEHRAVTQSMASRVELLNAETQVAEGQHTGDQRLLNSIREATEAYRANLDNEYRILQSQLAKRESAVESNALHMREERVNWRYICMQCAPQRLFEGEDVMILFAEQEVPRDHQLFPGFRLAWHLAVCVYVFVGLSVCLPVCCLSVCLSSCLSVCLSACLPWPIRSCDGTFGCAASRALRFEAAHCCTRCAYRVSGYCSARAAFAQAKSERSSVSFPFFSQSVVAWQWLHRSGFCDYDASTSQRIERKWLGRQKHVSVEFRFLHYRGSLTHAPCRRR